MEEKDQEIIEKSKKFWTKVSWGVIIYLVGYTLGSKQNDKFIEESYKRGVSDTLGSIIFKQR